MEDTIFIKVLQHGEEAGFEGTNFSLLKKYIEKELLINFDHSGHRHKEAPLKALFEECFDLFGGGAEGKNAVLKSEYYFRLLEYRELQEARRSAKAANKNAFVAIGISVFAVVVTVIVIFTQFKIPITINKSDLQALVDTVSTQKIQQEVKLNNLQMAQILSAIESSQSRPKIQKTKTALPSNEVQHHELINRYFDEE